MSRIMRENHHPTLSQWAFDAVASIPIGGRQRELPRQRGRGCDHRGRGRNEEATSKGRLAATRNWKRQGTGSP